MRSPASSACTTCGTRRPTKPSWRARICPWSASCLGTGDTGQRQATLTLPMLTLWRRRSRLGRHFVLPARSRPAAALTAARLASRLHAATPNLRLLARPTSVALPAEQSSRTRQGSAYPGPSNRWDSALARRQAKRPGVRLGLARSAMSRAFTPSSSSPRRTKPIRPAIPSSPCRTHARLTVASMYLRCYSSKLSRKDLRESHRRQSQRSSPVMADILTKHQ